MKNEILALRQEGLPYAEIRRRTGAAKATISYHAIWLNEGRASHWGAGRRYDWEEVQRFYDEGHGASECMRSFGFTGGAWAKAIQSGRIVRRDYRIPLDELLVEGARHGAWLPQVPAVPGGPTRERVWCLRNHRLVG